MPVALDKGRRQFRGDLLALGQIQAAAQFGAQLFDVLVDGNRHRRLLDVGEGRRRRAWRNGRVGDRGSDRRSRWVGDPIFWRRPQGGD